MTFARGRWLAVVAAVCLATPNANAQPAPELTYDSPAVSEPMLASPPAPPQQVESWDDALAMLRAHSPDYMSSYESVKRAEAQSRIALAAVLPVLSAQGSYVHQFFTETIVLGPPPAPPFVTPPRDTLGASATLQWNVFNPRAFYAMGTADVNVDVAKLAFSDRRREIALSVVNSMLGTLAAARVAELNRVGLRSALERLALTQARLQFGQGTPLDVDRAEQDVAAARALLITGDEALRQSREALGAALGSTHKLVLRDSGWRATTQVRVARGP
jgi:outer membrane protein TolC